MSDVNEKCVPRENEHAKGCDGVNKADRVEDFAYVQGDVMKMGGTPFFPSHCTSSLRPYPLAYDPSPSPAQPTLY